jgi:hypothetical protein
MLAQHKFIGNNQLSIGSTQDIKHGYAPGNLAKHFCIMGQ